MNAFKSSLAPVGWKAGIVLSASAITCFHLSHASLAPGLHRLFAFGYLVALLQLARLRTTRRSFYTGLATGFLCVAPQLACFWEIFSAAAIPLWTVLALWIGLFTAITHLVLRQFGPRACCLLAPFLWTGLEFFRSELYYLRFSWLNTGYLAAELPGLPISWVGMYGLGFAAAACAAFLLTMHRRVALPAVAAVILLGMLLPERRAPNADAGNVPLRIAGVQMEFPPEAALPKALDALVTRHPAADLLVLSEYTLDGPVPDSLLAWCRTQRRYLIVGGKDPVGDNFYNTAFVIGPEGEIVFKQVKSVPIQFFKDGLPASRLEPWASPWGRIGIGICYDLSYTRVTDRLMEQGAQLLIVPTMDVAEWGRRQHQLHALVAPVRAAEYGVPIFRLASSGISQAIDARGQVIAETGFPGVNETLYAELIPAANPSRPVDRALAPACVAVSGITLLALAARHRGLRRWKTPSPSSARSAPVALSAR